MTRTEWVDEVVRPWKDGDRLQVRAVGITLPFCDIECADPIRFGPIFEQYEYRIKPRMRQVVIEMPEQFSIGLFEQLADFIEGKDDIAFSPKFSSAIRNAKPLQGPE